MRRIFTAFALALVTLSVFSQNRDIPAGMRMEITSVGEDDEQYSIFTYKDEDGTFGYYLSLGHEFRLLDILTDDDLFSSLSHIDEMCLYLGETPEETVASLDSYLALLEEETGTTAEFPCRLTNGADRLTDHSKAVCIVVKRFLQRKRLCFNFTVGGRTAQTDLTKSGIKSLRWNFNLAQKLGLAD